MKPEVVKPGWLAKIPDALLNDFVVVTRGLYDGQKPGVIICLFRNHRIVGPGKTTALLNGLPFSGHLDKVPRMYVMTYVLDGTAAVANNGRNYTGRPGDFFQLNGESIEGYKVRPAAAGGLIECALCLDPYTGDVLREQQIWDARIETGHIGCQPAVVHAFLDFFESLRTAALDAGTLLRRLAWLLESVYTLNKAKPPEITFIEEARQLLAKNCGPQQSMHDIARHFHVSYSLFRRKFRQLTGVSPQAFALRVRMDRACELLLDHSVKEAASKLGYTDAFMFSRQFKQRFQIAPSEFRARFNSGAASKQAE